MKVVFRVFLLSSILLLFACNDDDSGGGSVSNDDDEELTSINLINSSGVTIFSFSIIKTDGSAWGVNLLGDTVLFSGDQRKVVGIPCYGYFDVKVQDQDNNIIATKSKWYLSCVKNYNWEILQ